MRTRRTGTVGVVVSQLTNPFYPVALVAVGEALAAVGQRMVLFSSDQSEDAALASITQGLLDGVLFTSGTVESEALRAAAERGSPIVLLNRSVPEVQGDQVTSDNFAGAAAVARHLVGLGHRRIGFIGGPPLPSTVNERHAAFVDTLRALGRPLSDDLCRFGPLSYEHGRVALAELLLHPAPPTAVFCVNDLTAFGALDAAREARLLVPDLVSIVGYDDVPMAAWSAFGLTTVRQPIARMAARSVEMLLERIATPSLEPRHERFDAELVMRRTTGAPPVDS